VATSKASLFPANFEVMQFLVKDIQLMLFQPEETIINQGAVSDGMFIIAYGNCEVTVKDHMGQMSRKVRWLSQGQHFGEIGLLYESVRTATVKSSDYSTMVRIGKSMFDEMLTQFPDIELNMSEHAYKYDDPWKQFKKLVLGQVDYFDMQDQIEKNELLEELQYHVGEEYFEP
jgi:CRP-like cAMP-binding protein